MSIVERLRIGSFYLLLSLSALLWCVVTIWFTPFLSLKWRYQLVVRSWCSVAVWLAKHIAGINYRVVGAENIPAERCVILAKHQSTWETFFLSAYFGPLSQVLKKELLKVPFFGWALAATKPIAIDRNNPKQALKQLASQGAERLDEGAWVLIFPEGTRIAVGEEGIFSRGGAALAVNAGLPVLPIAHNAGEFWPKEGWAKHTGTITVEIGAPMYAEGEGPRAIAELNQRAEAWINERVRAISTTASTH